MANTGRAWALVFLFLQVIWLSVNGQQQVVSQEQRTALEEFLRAVWPNSGYNSSQDPCLSLQESLNCTAGQITGIHLRSQGLTGEIPPKTLSTFGELQILDLSNNTLRVSLTELSSLPKLQVLDLSRNNVSGFPQNIGNLSQLVILDLSWNFLEGSVLQEVSKLKQLKTLNLSHNKFGGDIATVFDDLPNLEVLDLSGNSFSGSIPVVSVCKPRNLKSVNLSSNKFTGNISTQPSDLCNSLETLDLSFNLLDGLFPPLIFQIPTLRVLDFRMNNLSGSLPVSPQGQSITEINLESNSLDGVIPQAVLQFPRLVKLKLGKNKFSGSLNSNFSGTALKELDLHSNQLSGTLPLLPQGLEILDLHDNSFSGDLPQSLWQIQTLRYLDLSSNDFQGDFPSSNITLLPNLLRISLAHIKFPNYSFPVELGSLSNLEFLDLSGTNLSGTIPTSISELNGSLATLNLSRNSLEGGIPSVINTFKKLAVLDLSSNKLDGNISLPATAGELSGTLTVLDLSSNSLDGEIPPLMSTLTKLSHLDLSRNNFEGEIPPNMIDLTELTFLDLSFNKLVGEIPVKGQWITFPGSSFVNNSGLCYNISISRDIPQCSSRASAPAPLSSLNDSGSSSGKNLGLIIGLVTGLTFLLIVVVGLLIWCRVTMAVKPLLKDDQPMTRQIFSGPLFLEKESVAWAKSGSSGKDPHTVPVVMFEKPLLRLTLGDLKQATANFSKEYEIADGGYGPVYKGVLPDGTQLAIKVLREVKFTDVKDATARIEELANMKHPNLVALVGYCLVGEESLLIYDFMVNGDLHHWLHELPEGIRDPEDWTGDTWESMDGEEDVSVVVSVGENVLDWPTRHKIALGVARALALLHHGSSPPIIHRDVKSSNILLDDSFEAHLVDCGLAGIAKPDTPVIGGTVGYVPPEYGGSWQATPRGDVYSFGVVLLELVTGRKPTGLYFRDSYGGNLVGWVRLMVKDKKSQKALDRKIVRKADENHMLEVLRIGCLCTAEAPAKRPTMQQVVGLLRDCQP